MVYYSQLIGKPILDSKFVRIGVIKDFCFNDGAKYAPIKGIILDYENKKVAISWTYVGEIGDKPEDKKNKLGIYLNREEKKIKFSVPTGPFLRDILDKQIIDIKGARIVRANDILLGKVRRKFAIIGVSVSNMAILRRLGLTMLFKGTQEHIIMWKDVGPLSTNIKNLKLNTKKDRLNQLHPTELADLIGELSLEEKMEFFNSLSKEKAANTLISAQPDVQQTVFKTFSSKEIAPLLESMSTHEAAAILNMMPTVSKAKVFKLMKPGIAARIKKVLSYAKSTAGAVMSTRFFTVPVEFTVGQTKEHLKKDMPMPRYMIYIYINDSEGRLKGVCSFRDIMFAEDYQNIMEIAKTEVVTVSPNTGVDIIFNIMSKYEYLTLPVVDKDKKLVGVIRVHDLFSQLVPARIKREKVTRSRYRKEFSNNTSGTNGISDAKNNTLSEVNKQ